MCLSHTEHTLLYHSTEQKKEQLYEHSHTSTETAILNKLHEFSKLSPEW